MMLWFWVGINNVEIHHLQHGKRKRNDACLEEYLSSADDRCR